MPSPGSRCRNSRTIPAAGVARLSRAGGRLGGPATRGMRSRSSSAAAGEHASRERTSRTTSGGRWAPSGMAPSGMAPSGMAPNGLANGTAAITASPRMTLRSALCRCGASKAVFVKAACDLSHKAISTARTVGGSREPMTPRGVVAPAGHEAQEADLPSVGGRSCSQFRCLERRGVYLKGDSGICLIRTTRRLSWSPWAASLPLGESPSGTAVLRRPRRERRARTARCDNCSIYRGSVTRRRLGLG